MVDQVGSLDSQSGQGSEGRWQPRGFVLSHQGVQQGYNNVAAPPGMPTAGGFVMQPPRPGHGGAPLLHVYPPGQHGPPPSYYGGPRAPPFQQSHHQMLMPRPGGVHNGQHFPPPPPPPQPATAGSRHSAPGNSPVVTLAQPPLAFAPSIRPAPVAPSSMLLSHSNADFNSHKLAGADQNEDLNQSFLLARSSPSVDSDMEMEDDITQLDNNHLPIQHVGGTYTNNMMGSDFEAEKRSNTLQTSEEHFGGSSSSGNKENSVTPVPKENKDLVTASVVSEYENVSENSGQRVRGGSSFKLLQGYSSDDSSENDDKSSSRNTSRQRMIQHVTGSDSSNVQKKENDSELHVNLSNIDKAGELETTVEGTLSKVQTKALDSRKIDRFGRLVREGVINSDSDDSDDSGDSRRRSRRRKSRSRSSSHSRSRNQSPLGRRWRRGKSPPRRRGKSPQRRMGKSPQRRRGNRSGSRSWSPRRRRSTSRSPSFRRTAGFNDGNERRDKGQMGDCFNFLRGKCYRGSFCRYYHPDVERKDVPRNHRNMQQQYSRTAGAHEDTRKSPRKDADHKYETMSSEMLHSDDVPVRNVDDSANKNESPVKQADVSSSKFVPEGKSGSSPVECATSETFPSAESFVHISTTLPHLPSASFSEAVNAPPGIQLGRYPDLVQQGMPFRPPYAPVANASSSSMAISNPRLLWPVHNPPGSAEASLPTSIGQFQPNNLPQNHGGSSQMLLGPYSRRFQDQFKVMSGSGSLTEGGILPNSGGLSHESPAMRPQSFSSTILPPGGTSMSSFQEQAHSQQQQPLGVVPHSAADTIYDSGKDGNTFPPSHVDNNDLSVPRRLTHYNPYASTFEEPRTSVFSSIAFQNEKGSLPSAKHGHNNLTVSNSSFDMQVISNVEAGADLYDPFDAVGQSLTSIEKVDRNKTEDASDDSENLLRLSGSTKPLDAEENRAEGHGMDAASSFGSKEFGGTGNAEVGDVDNASRSNSHATKDHHTGEAEIDEDKSPGKCKKRGDSRSTKLFKACLANFVKEVLKPSWRQGNMSKEAFKTVVKKTVDKVSGAMKGHRAPKSKAKIDQYINSSQPKLTKLVLGYVDKYARG